MNAVSSGNGMVKVLEMIPQWGSELVTSILERTFLEGSQTSETPRSAFHGL